MDTSSLSFETHAGKLPWTEGGIELLFLIKKTIEEHKRPKSFPPNKKSKVRYITESNTSYLVQVYPKMTRIKTA